MYIFCTFYLSVKVSLGEARGTRTPCGPNFINFMEFLRKFGKNIYVGIPPPLETWHPHLREILDVPLKAEPDSYQHDATAASRRDIQHVIPSNLDTTTYVARRNQVKGPYKLYIRTTPCMLSSSIPFVDPERGTHKRQHLSTPSDNASNDKDWDVDNEGKTSVRPSTYHYDSDGSGQKKKVIDIKTQQYIRADRYRDKLPSRDYQSRMGPQLLK